MTIGAGALCVHDVTAQTYKMNVLTVHVQLYGRNGQPDAYFVHFFLLFVFAL